MSGSHPLGAVPLRAAISGRRPSRTIYRNRPDPGVRRSLSAAAVLPRAPPVGLVRPSAKDESRTAAELVRRPVPRLLVPGDRRLDAPDNQVHGLFREKPATGALLLPAS